ncbi:hypothetical protein ScPMuIL_013757 [Solemya velum]
MLSWKSFGWDFSTKQLLKCCGFFGSEDTAEKKCDDELSEEKPILIRSENKKPSVIGGHDEKLSGSRDSVPDGAESDVTCSSMKSHRKHHHHKPRNGKEGSVSSNRRRDSPKNRNGEDISQGRNVIPDGADSDKISKGSIRSRQSAKVNEHRKSDSTGKSVKLAHTSETGETVKADSELRRVSRSSRSSKTNRSRAHSDSISSKRNQSQQKERGVSSRNRKVSNGSAYAYEDDETSSDSDDEVLKRYQKSLVTGPGVRQSESSRSLKEKLISPEHGRLPASVDHDTVVQESSDADEKSTPGSPANQNISAHSGSASEPTSTASASPQEPRQTPYDNQAFQSERATISQTETEQLSMSERFSTTDEHLFDVSDLQQEANLISRCGTLEVTFSYDPKRGRMALTIHQARDIPSKERGGANSSQVRVLLLPTRKQRHKTKVKAGENPVFQEAYIFTKIPPEEVQGMGVRFRLYGCERMRRERMIGESIVGFASLNLETATTHWVVLEPRSNLSGGDSRFDVSSLSRSDSASSTQSLQHGGMPELLLGLSYNGTTGRLSVEVIKGSNFRNMAMNRAPDTYVKLTLMSPTGQEVTRSKTSVRRGQPNPLFKETFMFQVALFQLAEVTLMVSVYNKRSMKKKEMIGWFALGLNSSGEEEQSHWQDMRENKGDEVCRWHVLLES